MNALKREHPTLNNKAHRFVILGEGIYRWYVPRYETAKEAYDDLERYAREDRDQSPAYFTVYYEDKYGERTRA